jgi:DNA repair exonuclease SbcCD ATPase subunit
MKTVIIEEIKIHNWMAFKGENVLSIPSGSISVVAKYATNPRRSNWAGKTAFLEAIEWCLFGVHRKRYDDDIIHYGENKVQVKITFTNGVIVDRYRVRGKSTKLLVGIPNETQMTWTEKKLAQNLIEKKLGFDQVDYRATICFSQGDTEAIVEKTSGERRKLISQWLELDNWLRISSRAKLHLKGLMDEVNEARRSAINYSNLILDNVKEVVSKFHYNFNKMDEDDLNKFNQTVESWIMSDKSFCFTTDKEHILSKIEFDEDILAGVQKELQSLAGIEADYASHQQRLEYIQEGKELKNLIKDIKFEIGVEEARIEFDRLVGLKEIARVEVDKTTALLSTGFDGICPVTKKSCDISTQVESEIEIFKNRNNEARILYKNRCDEFNEQRSILNELTRKEMDIIKKRERFKVIVSEVRRLESASKRWENSSKPSQEDIHQLNLKNKELQNEIVDLRVHLEKIDKGINEIVDYRNKFNECNVLISHIEDKIKIANLVVQATNQSGIPGYLTEAILLKLESRANVLLEGSGLSFMFAMDRETKDLSPSCFSCGYIYRGKKDKACPVCKEVRGMKKSDELEILVDDGSGQIEDVKAKSGGAKVFIATAIRLTAGLMLREMRSSPCAFAQIDEVMGSLDSEIREILAQTFSGMLTTVGLDQAFVVSHDASFLDSLSSRILITRFSEHSTIEVL